LFPELDTTSASAPSPKAPPSGSAPPASGPMDKAPKSSAQPQVIIAAAGGQSEPAGPKTSPQDPGGSAGHPGLLPSDPATELPLPKSADASPPPGSPDGKAVADTHSESTGEFQGDGTVSETSPLGPQRPQLSIEKQRAHRPAAGLLHHRQEHRIE
jgi:hypothetical protein